VHAALSRAVVRNGNQLPKELVEGRSEPVHLIWRHLPGRMVWKLPDAGTRRGRIRPAAIRDISWLESHLPFGNVTVDGP
jgi:hypothetical protein